LSKQIDDYTFEEKSLPRPAVKSNLKMNFSGNAFEVRYIIHLDVCEGNPIKKNCLLM